MALDDAFCTSNSAMVVGTVAKKAWRKCLEDEAKMTPVRTKAPALMYQNSDCNETSTKMATTLRKFQNKTGAEAGNALLLLTEAYLKKISRPKRKVLEEDVYVREIENIIERDFFPYLDKLRAQETSADAVEEDDIRKLQSLISKYGRTCFVQSAGDIEKLEGTSSPSTFDTPLVSKGGERKIGNGQSIRNPSPPTASSYSESHGKKIETMENEKKESDKRLNHFMATVTSEDNVSFAEICALQSIAKKIKHSWIFTTEAQANSALEIQTERNTNIDSHSLALNDSSIVVGRAKQSIPLDTWPYRARNMLMFNPDGVDLALHEKVDAAKKAKMEVVYANTRFAPGFLDQQEKTAKLSEHVAHTKAMMKGIVGPDGKEIVPEPENKIVAGFSIVGTPSPMPGVAADLSPAMFWGSIGDTTALSSEHSCSRSMNTPIFKIPDFPERDKIGLKLAEKAAKNHRSKKARVLNEMQSKLAHSKSPSFGSVRSSNSSISRMSAMSPAAQLLAKHFKTLSGSSKETYSSVNPIDQALRNSYSPKSRQFTPSRSPLRSEKSVKHITSSPLVKTPSKSTKSSLHTQRSSTKADASLRTGSEVSMTDNLMELKNINKRVSAANFF